MGFSISHIKTEAGDFAFDSPYFAPLYEEWLKSAPKTKSWVLVFKEIDPIVQKISLAQRIKRFFSGIWLRKSKSKEEKTHGKEGA